MRKFILYNRELTESIDLNKDILATEPKGLGTIFSYKKYENHIYDQEKVFEPITFDLHFLKNSYKQYQDFLKFVHRNNNELTLAYSYNASYRYCDVFIEEIPKTEITNYNIISETIKFNRLTHWYERIRVSDNATTVLYAYGIVNNLNEPIPIIVQMQSSQHISLTIEVPGVGKTIINNIVNLKINSETKEVMESGVSVYEKVDKNNETFLYIPKGTFNLILTATGEADMLITMKRWLAD